MSVFWRFGVVLPVVLACYATSVRASESSEKNMKDFGDTMRYAMPAAGLGVSLFKRDWEGSRQWLRETVATAAMTEIIKDGFDDTAWGKRPNGGTKSFPSGHTSAACGGAAFLGKRYGWEYGAVAFPFAAATGYSRVDADKHHWRDVIGGCVLAYGMTELFVTKQGMENVIPVVGPDFIGLRLHIPFTDAGKPKEAEPYQYYNDDYSRY